MSELQCTGVADKSEPESNQISDMKKLSESRAMVVLE